MSLLFAVQRFRPNPRPPRRPAQAAAAAAGGFCLASGCRKLPVLNVLHKAAMHVWHHVITPAERVEGNQQLAAATVNQLPCLQTPGSCLAGKPTRWPL